MSLPAISIGTQLQIGFRIAHRGRLTHFFSAIAVILIGGCLLAAQFSGRQPATVALDVGLSIIRLLLPILSTLLLLELFYREFDRKYHLLSLTYPISRLSFLAGRAAVASAYTVGALLLLAAVLWLTVRMIGQGYSQGHPPGLGLPFVITISFIAVDLMVAIAIGTLISITASSASFVLVGTLGFILCARSFSPIIDLLQRDNTLVTHAATYQSSLNVLGYVFPDLARLDIRMAALYNTTFFLPHDWPILLFSTAAYALALFVLSAWLIKRRRFS